MEGNFKYLREKHLIESVILIIKLVADKRSSRFDTLNGLLKLQIIDLINLGYEFNDDENCVEFGLKSTVSTAGNDIYNFNQKCDEDESVEVISGIVNKKMDGEDVKIREEAYSKYMNMFE